MHLAANARDKLDRLQRERIALLEGFDDKRSGLEGGRRRLPDGVEQYRRHV
jgi:hypothetical protein